MKNASVTLITVLLALMAGNTMAAEEAEYSVTVQNDKLEIREYAPSIVAEVVVSDTFEDASGAAFRKLFNYISGDNTGRSKIAMTSPVTQTHKSPKRLP